MNHPVSLEDAFFVAVLRIEMLPGSPLADVWTRLHGVATSRSLAAVAHDASGSIELRFDAAYGASHGPTSIRACRG
jgi:hypothetical protein